MAVFLNNLKTEFQISFKGKKSNVINYKRILNEEKYDEFVSSIIRKEKKNNNGIIFRYKDFLTKKEIKKYNSDLKNSIGNYIINNNLHIIKNAEEKDMFIDIVKKI